MSKISDTSLFDWKDGDVVSAKEYKQERNILKTSINDNFDRLIKKYEVVTTSGTIKSTQNLDTAINYLKFKESSQIVLSLDTATSTMTIGVIDGSITTAKLADLGITTAKLADLSVTTVKVADLSITTGKVADSAINLQKIDTTSLDTRYYTKTLLDGGQLDNRYYTETEVNGIRDNLAGSGRTTETIKGNADNLVTHKSSSDHDTRYYQKVTLDNGALDTRYYTETEIDNKLGSANGGESTSVRDETVFPTSTDSHVLWRSDTKKFYIGNGSTWVEYAKQGDLNAHTTSTSNPHSVTASQVGAEPAFIKNTGFNLNLGNVAGTVAEGDIRQRSTSPLVAEVRTTDPTSPVVGQIWLRSDL